MNRRRPEQIVKTLHKTDEELTKGKAIVVGVAMDRGIIRSVEQVTTLSWRRKRHHL
jgi:hypothetical protein